MNVVELYENGLSCMKISRETGLSIHRVRTLLKSSGTKMRTYSEAQKGLLDSGEVSHPTKGKKQSQETLDKISNSVSKTWSDKTDKQKEDFSNKARANWDGMSRDAKDRFREQGAQAVRESGRNGSKSEKYVLEHLTKDGFDVTVHMKDLIPDEKLEVDMYIPSLRTAIEIDGPSHFLPIWGDEKLARQVSADTKKQGLVLASGYIMLRVRHLDKSVSQKRLRAMYDAIKEELAVIYENPPGVGKRLIEIEVKDGESRRV